MKSKSVIDGKKSALGNVTWSGERGQVLFKEEEIYRLLTDLETPFWVIKDGGRNSAGYVVMQK